MGPNSTKPADTNSPPGPETGLARRFTGAAPAARLWRGYRAGWRRFLWLILGAVLSPVYLVVPILAFLGAVGTVVLAGAGLIVAVPAVALAVGFGRGDLWLARILLDADFEPLPPATGSFWRRRVVNPNYWRFSSYLLLRSLWSAIALVLLFLPLALSVKWAPKAPEDTVDLGVVPAPSIFTEAAVFLLLFLIVFVYLPLAAFWLVVADRWLISSLIAVVDRSEVRKLNEEVSSLTQARKFMVESIGAERRRIERDLHDGPQQILTSVAMDLGLALRQLDRDPTAAKPHVQRAHAAAKEATIALRHVIRAVHPPVLTERGLTAAVSALAGRSALPVRVRSQLDFRFDPAAEAALYFCVSEALTNATKHADATSVTVEIFSSTDRVLVVVRDDGRGGASEPELDDHNGGSGLVGLRKRLLGVQGDVEVVSPVGVGTTLTFTVPYERGAPLPLNEAHEAQ